jgi:hypothetical protein
MEVAEIAGRVGVAAERLAPGINVAAARRRHLTELAVSLGRLGQQNALRCAGPGPLRRVDAIALLVLLRRRGCPAAEAELLKVTACSAAESAKRSENGDDTGRAGSGCRATSTTRVDPNEFEENERR